MHYNYGLLLNIDRLQPYKHIQYSVGIVYLVILNLPRSIRYKRQNVILFGIIPGPSEPSLSINSYLLALVRELQQLLNGVEMKLPGSVSMTRVRCAHIGVACDLPAARKTCSFLVFQQTWVVLVAISNFLEDLVKEEIILILIETTGSYVLIVITDLM